MTTTDQTTRHTPFDPKPSTDRTIGALWDLAALADRLSERAEVSVITAGVDGTLGGTHRLQVNAEPGLGAVARVCVELGLAQLRLRGDCRHYSWWVDSIEVVMVR